MLHPQRKTMDLVPLVCLCLLTWSAGTAADHKPVVVNVELGSDVILPCSLSTQQSLTYEYFEWKKDQKQVFKYDGGVHSKSNPTGQDEQFKDRVIYFSEQLKNGSASIKIRNTQLADSGDYTCDFSRLQPPQTFHIKLVVVGEAAKPSLKQVLTKDGMLLQCEVKGASPKPKVVWKDSAGNILPAKELPAEKGSYDVILQAPVTKTDNFTCVVTQEEIHHQISDWTYAALNEKTSNKLIIGIIATLIVGIVGAVFGIVGIVLAVRARSERSNTAANCSYGDNRNSGINGQAEENIHLSSPETKSASKDQDNTPV